MTIRRIAVIGAGTMGGGIAMASLNAQASGLADPTSNDTDTARAGIFLAANGGAIGVTRDVVPDSAPMCQQLTQRRATMH